ncbi:MAG: hypothetical protein J7L55_02985 [Desulfurococcales archaeon]|nr:hypothetical protein [Desulfurococcales archaeon]
MYLTLKKGDVVRVSGPAKVTVASGEVLLLGATYVEGASLTIHRFRSYAMLALRDSTLDIRVGEGGEAAKVGPSDEVVVEWLRIAESLWSYYSEEGSLKVVIVGPVESGKTSSAAFISNYFTSRGETVYLLEADVGQEDLALPGTVALKKVTETFLWQRELGHDVLRFVGCIAPHVCKDEILCAVSDLSRLVPEGAPLVVNTDGWISGVKALMFKAGMIRWLRPTHILVTDVDAYTFMRSASLGAEVLYLPPPKVIRERDRAARRYLRRDLYRKYFLDSRVIEVSLSKVPFMKSRIFGGAEIPRGLVEEVIPQLKGAGKILRASKLGDSVYVLTENRVKEQHFTEGVKAYFFTPQDLRGCLVGLVGRKYEDVGVGIIESVKLRNGEVVLKIKTPVKDEVRGLIAGYIRLGSEYQEVGGEKGCFI